MKRWYNGAVKTFLSHIIARPLEVLEHLLVGVISVIQFHFHPNAFERPLDPHDEEQADCVGSQWSELACDVVDMLQRWIAFETLEDDAILLGVKRKQTFPSKSSLIFWMVP